MVGAQKICKITNIFLRIVIGFCLDGNTCHQECWCWTLCCLSPFWWRHFTEVLELPHCMCAVIYSNIHLTPLLQWPDSPFKRYENDGLWAIYNWAWNNSTTLFLSVRWFVCGQNKWHVECGDSRGLQYQPGWWFEVAQSLCRAICPRTCLVPLQVSSVWWAPVLARWNWLFHLMTVGCRSEMLFLILLYELYIFVDIMKHMKIVICIYMWSICTVYISNMYIFSLPLQR